MKRRQIGDLLRWIGWREGTQDACAPWTHLLSLYADSQATPAQAQRVEAHLESCASCRASLALLRATTQVAATWSEMEMPPGLSERLSLAIADEARRQRVEERETSRVTRRRFGVPQIAISGAAIAAVLGIGLYVADHHPSAPTRPVSVVAVKPAQGPLAGTGSVTGSRHTVVAVRPSAHPGTITTHRVIVARVPAETRPASTESPFLKPPAQIARPASQIEHARIAHSMQVAANIKPQASVFSHPHPKPHGLANTEIARAVKPSITLPREMGIPAHDDGVRVTTPPATVAAAISQPTPDAPVLRLASTLKSLARSTQRIEPGTDQISVSMVHTANYTGAATIVGSEIH